MRENDHDDDPIATEIGGA